MDLEDIKRGLRAEIKKRENEQYATFQCNVRQMCKDVLAKLEEQERVIKDLESENRFIKERLKQQEKVFKWHKVEILFGKLTGDLPSRDLNRIYGRDFLVHYTVKYGNCISDGMAYSDYDEDEGFFELEDNYTPVHWCEVPLPPLDEKFKPNNSTAQ